MYDRVASATDLFIHFHHGLLGALCLYVADRSAAEVVGFDLDEENVESTTLNLRENRPDMPRVMPTVVGLLCPGVRCYIGLGPTWHRYHGDRRHLRVGLLWLVVLYSENGAEHPVVRTLAFLRRAPGLEPDDLLLNLGKDHFINTEVEVDRWVWVKRRIRELVKGP